MIKRLFICPIERRKNMTTERWNKVNDIAHGYDLDDFNNPKDKKSAIRLLTKYYDEIMNGGFAQYFDNMDSGYGFHDHKNLLEALKTVGMEEFTAITEKAIMLNEKYEDLEAREDEYDDEDEFDEMSDELGQALEDLNMEFDDETFINKLYSFVDENF
jgi:hypothetical protein